MRNTVLAAAAALAVLTIPTEADAINWPIYASGFRCDDLGVCEDIIWELNPGTYQDLNGDAGTWVYGVDPYGQGFLTVFGATGFYELYGDNVCIDGAWNMTGYASLCVI